MNAAEREHLSSDVVRVAERYGDGAAGIMGLTGCVIGYFRAGAKGSAIGAAIGFGVGFGLKVLAIEAIAPALLPSVNA